LTKVFYAIATYVVKYVVEGKSLYSLT